MAKPLRQRGRASILDALRRRALRVADWLSPVLSVLYSGKQADARTLEPIGGWFSSSNASEEKGRGLRFAVEDPVAVLRTRMTGQRAASLGFSCRLLC